MANFVCMASSRRTEVDDIIQRHTVPVNCEALMPPRVNQEVWTSQNASVKARYVSVQKIQNLLAHGLTAIFRVAQELCKPKDTVDVSRFQTQV